jgi:hypothetical protein
MAQITAEEVEHPYREIHVENQLTDAEGQTSSLKPAAEIDVILEAGTDATMKVATLTKPLSVRVLLAGWTNSFFSLPNLASNRQFGSFPDHGSLSWLEDSKPLHSGE